MKRILTLLFLSLTLLISACNEKTNTNRIYVFSQPNCSHCINAHAYMTRYYKDYDIKELNIREGSNAAYMIRYARKFKVNEANLGTPFIVMGDKYIMGWGSEQIKEFNKYAKNFKPKSNKKQ
ncbi:MAG: glutaredoxin [Alphaproteobacteria bacterium]|nr:glutaredoxin [Alphaproteobacteria bacterium]